MSRRLICSICVVVVLGLVGSASAFQVVDDFEGGDLNIWEITEGQAAIAGEGRRAAAVTCGSAAPWLRLAGARAAELPSRRSGPGQLVPMRRRCERRDRERPGPGRVWRRCWSSSWPSPG